MINIWKPWYVYRPKQIVRRLVCAFRPRREDAACELPWGGLLRVDARKSIGKCLAQIGVYDLATSELLYRLVQPGDNVLDIGANIGYMTALLAHRVGPTGRVVAFEPHPALYQRLTENVESLRRCCTNGPIEIHCSAVSNSSGTAIFVSPDDFIQNDGVSHIATSAVNGSESCSVETVALDDFVNEVEQFSVMKVDIEGHEEQAFKGAMRVLHNNVKHIVFEDHQGPYSTTCELLANCGFTIMQFGWTMSGLKVGKVGEAKLSRDYEAPSFVATRQPDEIYERCRSNGWQVLRG